MSTITTLNNGDSGSTFRTNLNTNLSNLNTDKLESSDLANYETSTQLDARDTANRARANHTGTQTASTISDFDTEVSNNTDVAANTSARHNAVTVTDSAEIDFTLTGQDITADLKTTTVTPGSYTNADITVDSKGRITLASNGSGGGATTLGGLSDVTITTPINGQVITYNSTSGDWENATLPGGGDMLSSVYDPTSVAGDAFDANNHSISVIGSPTINSVQEYLSVTGSAGIMGTLPTITDNGDGSIGLPAIEVAIRATNSDIAEILVSPVSANATISLTDANINYIYVEYNAGTPQYVATTSKRTDENTNVWIAEIYRNGTTLHINPYVARRFNDNFARIARRFTQTQAFQRVSGGAISETGTRNIAISAGSWWTCTNPFSTNAFDSSGADTFYTSYQDGLGGVTLTAGQSQIDATYYDDGSGTLANLTSNNYGTRWVYLETDNHVVVVYGSTNSSQLVDAQNEAEPTVIPQSTLTQGRLIGKIIVRQGNSTFTSVTSAFTTTYELAQISDHNNLSGRTDASQHPLSSISIPTIGTPTIVTNAGDAFNHMWSAGSLEGFALTDNGDGTVDIASGEIALRSGATEDDDIYILTVGATAGVTLTDNSINYIYVNYNSGTPVVQVGTALTDFNCLDKCILYTVVREGTVLNHVDARNQNVDANRKHRRALLEAEPFRHVRGGCILGASGTRNISVTAGAFYYGLSKISHSAFDTSVTDTFKYYYRDGVGGWTIQTAQTQINNTQYDDGTGTLATLSNNKYGVHWVYLINNTPSNLIVQFGQGDYNTLADAQAATVPAVPPIIDGLGVLLGRIIIFKGASTFSDLSSAFTTSFSPGVANNHNLLSGLQGGTANEYYHLTSAKYTVVQNTSGTNSGDETTTTIGSLINSATEKTTPVDADMVGLMDSAASNILKKLSWANIKATLKTYFDTLYTPVGAGTSFWTLVPGTPTRVSNTQFTITDTGNAGLYDQLLQRGTVLKWTDTTTKQAMVTSATYATDTVTVNIMGDILSATATMSTVAYGLEKAREMLFTITGSIGTTGTDLANKRKINYPSKIFGCDLSSGTAGNGTTTVDINKNGTTIFTTKPSITTTNQDSDGNTADDGTSATTDDKITIDVDAVAATTAITDLYVYLYYTPLYNANLT